MVVAVFKIWQCLWPRENSIDRETWRATVHDVTESWTRLSVHARKHTHLGKNVEKKLCYKRESLSFEKEER